MNEIPNFSLEQILIYETNTSWWAGMVSHPGLQRLVGKYYLWKARRKYARLRHAALWQGRLDTLRRAGLL